MTEVHFHNYAEDHILKFAVIIVLHNNKLVFCKHKKRETLEFPGGHREKGETIEETARRELWEETGALNFELTSICTYSVLKNGYESFGQLFFADIHILGTLPESEIDHIVLSNKLPEKWTYPDIMPTLLKFAANNLPELSTYL